LIVVSSETVAAETVAAESVAAPILCSTGKVTPSENERHGSQAFESDPILPFFLSSILCLKRFDEIFWWSKSFSESSFF